MKRWKSIRLNLLLYSLIFMMIIACSLTFNTSIAKGYVDELGDVTGMSVSGDTLTLTVDNGSEDNDDILEIQVCEENILRVNYRPNDIDASDDTPMLDPDKTWNTVGSTIDTSSDPITITTDDMIVEIAKTPCRMTIKNSSGTSLLWESSTGGMYYDAIRFKHSTSDNIYGIKGYNFTEGDGDILRNDSDHAAHAGQQGDSGGPLMWSTAGYGVLVDSDGGYPYTNSTNGQLEFYYGGTPDEGRRYVKEDLEYFIMLGDPKEIMSAVSKITGKTPMMPKWSLGFSNFEWDTDQTEMTEMVNTYRAKNIPIDSYGLDYDWKNYGETNYGEFAWNTTNFPSASSTDFKDIMDNLGIKMIGITKPRIVTLDSDSQRTTQYYDAENNNYWYPDHYEYEDYFIPVYVRSVDPYNSSVRSWLWDHSEDAFDKGIVGWWNDETDKVSSGSAQYWFGNFTTTHWSQAMYEGQRSYSDRRVWQTARTFYPGAQRYATTLWSGDIGIQYYQGERIDWTVGMQEQRATMLSSINLGQTKWGMDIGGFNQADGTTNNPSPELYSKWVQFGSTVPVFRVHGNNGQQRQPWLYGNTAEETAKYAIQLRYGLIPYMYAYERNVYEEGVGLVRPLIYDYPSDSNVENYTDAWMFGDWILSAPVVDETQTIKSIYLPEGTWIDYNTGIIYSGGTTIQYPVNAQTWADIPMFIKNGAIIPSQEVLNYVGESSISTIYVDVFPDSNETSFIYYDDDGDNYDYEETGYFKQTLSTQDEGNNDINFTISAKSGSYSPDSFYYIVKIHGTCAEDVTLEGQPLTSETDLNALKAEDGECYATGKDIYGDVTYVKILAGSSSAKNIELSGNSSSTLTAYQYEAEEASLWGDSTSTQASINTNHNNYSGSGFVDGLDNEEAGVTFYTKVKVGGDYDVSLRYANATGAAQTISIFVNGTRIKQTSLANLSDWDTWSTQTETLPLTAGNNIISYTYYSDSGDTGNVNLDYITVPFEPVTAKYEAENAELDGDAAVDKDHYFYSGVGFVDGYDTTGAEAEFKVYVPTAGDYEVVVRYANGNEATKTLSTYVNGTDVDTASFTSPGNDWNVWQDYQQTLSLSEGANTIAYTRDSSDSGAVNIDRILVKATTPETPESEKNLLDNGGFERINYDSQWYEWYPSGQDSAFGMDSGSGSNPPESAWTGNYRAYFWDEDSYQQSIHQEISVSNGIYKFEAWVRLKNTTPNTARAEIAQYGGSQINIDISNEGVWKYISCDNISVTSGTIDVGFYVDSAGGTTLHIDDVRLTKVD